jgi:hypothetical protein
MIWQFYLTILTFHILNIHNSWYFGRRNVSSHLMNPGVFFSWQMEFYSFWLTLSIFECEKWTSKRGFHILDLSLGLPHPCIFLSLISSAIFVSHFSSFLFFFSTTYLSFTSFWVWFFFLIDVLISFSISFFSLF